MYRTDMSETIKVTGMVLAGTPVGESDKRVVILTRERGKLSAFAKGARRQNSPLLAGTRPFSFGEFFLLEGRNSYIIHSMQISNYFYELSEDLEGTAYGMYFLELASYYSYENMDGSGMILLLYQSFRALLNKKLENELVRLIFELKAMVQNGEYPQMFACVHCKKTEELMAFSVRENGVVCSLCKRQVADAMPIAISTVYALQYIVSSPVEKLYTFQVSQEVLLELQKIVKQCMNQRMDRKIKSLEILEEMKSVFSC